MVCAISFLVLQENRHGSTLGSHSLQNVILYFNMFRVRTYSVANQNTIRHSIIQYIPCPFPLYNIHYMRCHWLGISRFQFPPEFIINKWIINKSAPFNQFHIKSTRMPPNFSLLNTLYSWMVWLCIYIFSDSFIQINDIPAYQSIRDKTHFQSSPSIYNIYIYFDYVMSSRCSTIYY